MSKERKKLKVKSSLKLASTDPSSEWLHHHPIHGDERKREPWERVSMDESVNLLTADCVN